MKATRFLEPDGGYSTASCAVNICDESATHELIVDNSRLCSDGVYVCEEHAEWIDISGATSERRDVVPA